MAVALSELYMEITPKYKMELQTESCFQKVIEWIHMIDNKQFIKLLHGNELILNTGVPYTSTEWLLDFIELLHEANAGGLVICLHEGECLPQEALTLANALEFPVFTTDWDCPFVELTRIFAAVLLRNEQKETNLITALKNAISHPANREGYVQAFECNGFATGQEYVIVLLSCYAYQKDMANPRLKQIEKSIQYMNYRKIVYEEGGILVALFAGEKLQTIIDLFRQFCQRDKYIYVGIGTQVSHSWDIYRSYACANSAYQLTKTAIDTNILWYDGLGVYKLLSNLKEPQLGEEYVREVLGKLIDYDKENDTDYMNILKVFFENECSILHASKELFCHKNTLTYKINRIKEILGFDIMLNENRMRIILSFQLLKMY